MGPPLVGANLRGQYHCERDADGFRRLGQFPICRQTVNLDQGNEARLSVLILSDGRQATTPFSEWRVTRS